MEIFRSQEQLRPFIERQKEMGKKIGFAPTMGALHAGHLSLYQKAREENDLVISSIYVNPTQFNNTEDLEKYPRNINRDIELLQNSGLVDAVYIPENKDIYPEGLASKTYNFGTIALQMEGKMRPGHFDGVGTVVETLFRQVKPDNAYFGEKDFQQLAIIRKMTEQTQLPINIKGVPIYRDQNGLALSSRNQRLTEIQKQSALILHQTLKQVNDWFRVLTVPEIKQRVQDIFDHQHEMKLEYFVIADEKTLEETDFYYKDRDFRAFLVVHFGDVRLIDNMHLD